MDPISQPYLSPLHPICFSLITVNSLQFSQPKCTLPLSLMKPFDTQHNCKVKCYVLSKATLPPPTQTPPSIHWYTLNITIISIIIFSYQTLGSLGVGTVSLSLIPQHQPSAWLQNERTNEAYYVRHCTEEALQQWFCVISFLKASMSTCYSYM